MRVALVGYGSAGRGIHAPLLIAAGCPPALVVSADPVRRSQAVADIRGVTVVPELAAALEREPDLVVLASPSGYHGENAARCIAAGVRGVVVDKPLATDAAQAAAVTRRARAAGVALTVFQNRRWDAENLTLARLLAGGELGQVYRFERRWERWRPVPKNRWRENEPAEHGGGTLLDLHTHLVDSAVQLFGPVTSVYAELASRTTVAEDEAFLALGHAGGVRSHLGATPLAGAPGPRTRVLGERAAYVVTELPGEPAGFPGYENAPGSCGWLVAGDRRTPVPAAPGGPQDFYPAVVAALAHPEPVVRQAAMPVQPADAVAVLAVIDAARRSAAEGRVTAPAPAALG